MLNIASHFLTDGAPVSVEPMGNGHINRTYLLKDNTGALYTFQKINDKIFLDIPALMENIHLVTSFLRASDPDPRHSLSLVPVKEGGVVYHDDTGWYRMYRFVGNSLCLERVESEHDFYQSAVAFGAFQQRLSAFDASKLSETIPRFHDTPNRVRLLKEAVKQDSCGRLNEVGALVDFALAREEESKTMLALLRAGEIKLRVTHNDTKLNNVLLDETTREPLCIIDLDTVMPGLAANDFGDSIRFGASTAAEDETDLDKVTMSLSLFRAYARGFLSACGSALNAREIETLPMGAKLMTYECGVRFLTDYLSGDTYFRIHHEKHNLERCLTQFKLVADMEAKWAQMANIIREENV